MKLSEAVDHYIATAGTLRTDQSRDTMRSIGRQLAAYAGNRQLGTYTAQDLTGFCLGHGGRGTAPHTIGSRLSMIRPFFNWCAWQKIIAHNPAADLQFTVKARGGNVRQHTWLVESEVVDITRSFNLEDPRQHRDLVVFRTTVMLGLRRSETASLRWESFSHDLSSVSFVGKGAKLATLPVPTALRADLERWHATQPAGAVLFPRFRWLFEADGSPRLNAKWTDPIGPAAVYYIVKDIAGRCGVTSLAPHDLRRSFAGIMASKGVGLKDLQGLMRHEMLATTDRYMKDDPARLARIVEGVTWGETSAPQPPPK